MLRTWQGSRHIKKSRGAEAEDVVMTGELNMVQLMSGQKGATGQKSTIMKTKHNIMMISCRHFR